MVIEFLSRMQKSLRARARRARSIFVRMIYCRFGELPRGENAFRSFFLCKANCVSRAQVDGCRKFFEAVEAASSCSVYIYGCNQHAR